MIFHIRILIYDDYYYLLLYTNYNDIIQFLSFSRSLLMGNNISALTLTLKFKPRVAKLRLASRMLIHFKLDYQGACPPLLYYNVGKQIKDYNTNNNIYSQ